jgi:hypothetical protein
VASRRRRPRALLSAVLALFACEVEETSTLEIAVRLDPPMEAQTSLPAEVLVGFDSSGSGFVVFRVGFLCTPDAPFFTTATFSGPGRGGPSAVDAWIVPIDRGSPFTCGPLATPQPVASPGGRSGVPRTSARVQVLGGCGVGDVRSATVVIGRSS